MRKWGVLFIALLLLIGCAALAEEVVVPEEVIEAVEEIQLVAAQGTLEKGADGKFYYYNAAGVRDNKYNEPAFENLYSQMRREVIE